MTLSTSLTIVFLAFCALMGGVLAYCIRERRIVERREQRQSKPTNTVENIRLGDPTSAREMEEHDQRIVLVLFGAIIGGAALALMTGYLVFFRTWS